MFRFALRVTTLLVVVSTLPHLFAQQAPAAAAHGFAGAERRVLAAEVAEYTFDVRVGSGPYDVIGLHRITKETAPGVPARTGRAVLLAPGDIWNFRAAFMTREQPLPLFLAEQGIDVWGIDYRWTKVPGDLTDTSFMRAWGIEQDAADVGFALAVARFARAATGSGFDPLFLLGWSRGGQIGYTYLGAETQLPRGRRQVRGFIPVDIYLKTDVPQLRAAACQRQQSTESAIAAGADAAATGALITLIGNLATASPTDPSPVVAGLTNRQTGLLVGEATFVLQGGLEFVPFYHFTGGVFDGAGNPAGLLYSSENDLFTFEQHASSFQPNRELAEGDAVVCEATNVPFDDHLGDITVPVLYLGAGGGFGDFGIYTTTLLGSTDVTTLVINKVPSTQRLLDYGHADLFLADDADELVWQPLVDWIRAH